MRAKDATRKPDRNIGHYRQPRVIKRPDGYYTIGSVPVDSNGETLDAPVEEGFMILPIGADRRELWKAAHDQVDRILEGEPVETKE